MLNLISLLAALLFSDSAEIGKEKSSFKGNVVLEWPQKVKIEADMAEKIKREGIVLGSISRPVRVDIFDPRLAIRSKKAIVDALCEKVLFIDEVSLTVGDYLFKGPHAECILEDLEPQVFSLCASKKEGCSLRSDFLKLLTYQRVNLDVSEKTAHFFQPRGEFAWNETSIAFSANWMKVEEDKIVLDGKIVIRAGTGVYTSNGPLVIHYDGEKLEPKMVHVEGKSHFSWNDYALQLDGLIHFEEGKLSLKSPERNGIVMKYPFGEVRSSRAEAAIADFKVEAVDLFGQVFATYGVPTLQHLVADAIRINLFENTADLFSKEEGRVLLYDQINKLEMSADQVRINWGERLGDERIEGIGDVRFTFDQKERGLIDALFKSR